MARTVAGRMRHLVDFQKDTATTQGTRGHSTPTWVTQQRAYCDIMPLTGNELVVQRQVRPTVTHKITTRWASSFTPLPTWRVKYGDRVFHIDGLINVDERNEFWEITATELIAVET